MAFLYRLKSLPFRIKFSLVALALLIFGLTSVVIISRQQQEIRSRASTDINGNVQGNLVGDDYRVNGTVLGSIIGSRNQVSQGVQGGIYGNDNSIVGNVGGCINGNNNRIYGNVTGGVVGLNNIVTGTKGTGDCPIPGAPTSTPTPTRVPTPTPTRIPTPTRTPTPSPTSAPTSTPTRTPTPTPTRLPTVTLSPTPTPTTPPGNTSLRLTLLLHGIGKGGDTANPNGGGNPNPRRPQRSVTVEILNSSNQLVLTKQGTVVFNPADGNFTGTIDLGSGITTGVYSIKIKSTQFLKSLVPGIQNITQGTVNQAAVTRMVNGDVDNNNSINILDYNVLIGCYSDFLPPTSCNEGSKAMSDLDDDGAVNQFDYNLFLRELTNRTGQ